VAQPALAVVWSFLLLSEMVNHRQMAGIAIVVSGLLAFVVLNQRGDRTRRMDEQREKRIASEGAGAKV
jgi:drug/metabolite transporter (DMT)-like permease